MQMSYIFTICVFMEKRIRKSVSMVAVHTLVWLGALDAVEIGCGPGLVLLTHDLYSLFD